MTTTTFTDPFIDADADGMSEQVPGEAPVSIAGRTYLVVDRPLGDLDVAYERRLVPSLRESQDTGAETGENSISQLTAWRRVIADWSHGAGQTKLDAPQSDRSRFRRSLGVDVWTEGELSLLPSTEIVLSSTATNLQMVQASTRVYVADGQTLRYTENGTVWFAVTGGPAVDITGIATDGATVWCGFGASGLYSTSTSTVTLTVLGSVAQTDGVWYGSGRLLVAEANVLKEVTYTGTRTTLWSHPNSQWVWTTAAAGPTAFYVAGRSGTSGDTVYRVPVNNTTGALESFTIPSAPLPTGVYVTALGVYVGVPVLGMSDGLRVGSFNAAGDIEYGKSIPVGPVKALSFKDNHVLFTWPRITATETGVGRADLSEFTSTLTPAYASDVYTTGTGDVNAVTTIGDTTLFAVSGAGVYRSTSLTVPSGWVDSGYLTYGVADRKAAVDIAVRHDPLDGVVTVGLGTDRGDAVTVGSSGAQGSTQVPALEVTGMSGYELEVRVTLTAGSGTGPKLLRWMIRAVTQVPRTTEFLVPVIVASHVYYENATGRYMNPADELQWLENVARSGVPVVYQEGRQSWLVRVENVRFRPYRWSGRVPGSTGFEGVAVLQMLSLG